MLMNWFLVTDICMETFANINIMNILHIISGLCPYLYGRLNELKNHGTIDVDQSEVTGVSRFG